MKNLASILKKLESNHIATVGLQYSTCEDTDHEITLCNGYYLQVGDNYYCIYRENENDTFTDFGTFTSFKSVVDKLKSIL